MIPRHLARVVLIYALVGVAWIVLSDVVLQRYWEEREFVVDQLLLINILKGIAYVMVTAVLLYFMLVQANRSIRSERSKAGRYNELLARTIEDISDIFVAIDKNWRVIYANQRYVQVTGKSRREVIGKTLTEVFPVELSPEALEEIREWMQSGEHRKFEYHSQDRKQHFLVAGHPFENGLAFYIQDVTELNRAKSVIEWQKVQMKLLLDNTSDLIWSVDREGKFLAFNEPFIQSYQRVFKHPPELGAPAVLADLDPGVIALWEDRYERAFKGEVLLLRDTEKDEDGTERVLEMRMYPLKVKEKVVGVACFSRDITQQNRYEQSIRQQNEVLKEISWTTAHDIRGPVATILGLINLLEYTEEHPNRVELDSLKAVANDLDAIIRELIRKAEYVEEMNAGSGEDPKDVS